MPSITVTARAGSPQETDADTRVVGLFEGETPDDDAARPLAESGEAKGGLRKLAVTHEDGGRRVIVVGLGKRDEFDHEKARGAAGAAAQRARELGAKALSWASPDGAGGPGPIVEGTLLALYEFKQFKSPSSDDDDSGAPIVSLEIVTEDADADAAVADARVRAEAANAARDLQNTPSNVATPSYLADRAEAIAGEHEALSFESFGRDEIESRGMGAFASVARGAHEEPRLIVLRYDGGGD